MECSCKQAQSEMGKKQKQEMGNETNEALVQFRPWADLPTEILFCIANRLTSFDQLLSFRKTCKHFRSASAGIKPCKDPWLLFYKPDSSECHIYDQNGSKLFKQNIPDLQGAVCLASYQGWLLVSNQESIFFFSPFSLSKITLPNFPHQQTDCHVAAFSDVPTSPHCIVSVINRNDDRSIEVNMISRGQNAWTRHNVSNFTIIFPVESTFTSATFDHTSRSFCYFDSAYWARTFSVKDKEWNSYCINHDNKWIPAFKRDIPIFSCYYTRHMFYNLIKEKRHQFDLEDDEYVSVCGLTYKDDKSRQVVYQNEAVYVSRMNICMRRAVWIQPRFYEADLKLQW